MNKELQSNLTNHTETEINLFTKYANYFNESPISIVGKLQNFPKYVRRQDLSRFLAKNELFKLQLDLPGSIIELGCFQGGGTFTFAQLSAIYEPYNHTRKIVSFDTFNGFPDISEKDMNTSKVYRTGDLSVISAMDDEIQQSINLFDSNRPISHITKIELIKGDATKTIPQYLIDNPHLVISMIYFDFDIYEPTKIGLETLINRIPKGGIIAFDELNTKVFPGETLALLDTIGIKNISLRKTVFDPYISYAIL
ncbi:MAG TPA: TylF/MycF/NovP-related O-methyltransferase [Saprospiraceae bacterium]|nr:TylF/MycF/NovP-related O-methyltransferase [Saprospiraceae bacterium]